MPEPVTVPARPASAPTACDAVALAFEKIGGVARFAEWIESSEDNFKVFYATIYPKILSLQTVTEAERPAIDEVRWTIVRP